MAVCNGTPFTVDQISHRAGLEPGTVRSVDQRLSHRATGASENRSDPSLTAPKVQSDLGLHCFAFRRQ